MDLVDVESNFVLSTTVCRIGETSFVFIVIFERRKSLSKALSLPSRVGLIGRETAQIAYHLPALCRTGAYLNTRLFLHCMSALHKFQNFPTGVIALRVCAFILSKY